MIIPLGNRLLVKKLEIKEVKLGNSGLIQSGEEVAPESVKGEVVACGDTVEGFKVGDVVLYAQFAPTQAKETPSDKTYIVPAEDVLAIVRSK